MSHRVISRTFDIKQRSVDSFQRLYVLLNRDVTLGKVALWLVFGFVLWFCGLFFFLNIRIQMKIQY